MARGKTPRRKPRPGKKTSAAKTPSAQTLRRRLARLIAERAVECRRHARQLAAVRRDADRRLTAMVQEIAELRHHQARVEALTRLLEERDAALAAQAARLAALEARLQHPGETPAA